MSITVASVQALEILDLRGRPTLATTVTTSEGASFRAGVPSGASTGSGEAVELRDRDPARYGGAGVLTATANVNGAINDALAGQEFTDLAQLDQTLIALDGTANKSALCANAIVGVSMAAARAFAATADLALWQYLTGETRTAGSPTSAPGPPG